MKMKNKSLLGTLAIGALGAAMLVVPSVASADSRSRCQQRVERAEHHFRDEVREHGRHSRQAESAKRSLNRVWDRCWTGSKAWYDPQKREWRTERDWDRNYDWDRDGDHDRDDRR